MAHRRHDRLQLAPRELCAPLYGARGGACSDLASRVLCEVAAHVDQSIDDAHVCRALHHSDQGHRYRALAGRHTHVPGEDDLCHFRSRVGDGVSHTTLAAVVALLQAFGLIKGELWSPDGPLAPSYARYQGCPYACEGCHAFRLDEAGRQAWRDPVRSGAQRLPLPCPLPEVVTQVREATAKKGNPTAPVVFLLASEDMADGAAARSDRQQGAPRLGLPAAEGPPGPSACVT